MMMWKIEILNETVEKEINDFPEDLRARLQRIIELLRTFGPHHLGEPYIKPLRKKLWEIRCKGKDGIGRVIYVAASGRRLVLLHAFIKKTQRTPARSLKLSMDRLKEMNNDT